MVLSAYPAGAAASAPRRSALLVFVDAGERELAAVPGMSVGIMSASQGRYTRSQLLLDISQGARISASAYGSAAPPLRLVARGSGGLITGWQLARARAAAAPQILTPGILAGSLAGGSAYAGVASSGAPDAAAAAGPGGAIAAVSLGSAASLPARAATLLGEHPFVVADLPAGASGVAQLARLAASRTPGELLIVVQRSEHPGTGALLWSAAAGLAGGGGHQLSSKSTNQAGLVVSVDIAPTVLQRLRTPPPSEVRGKPIETADARDPGALRALMARLRVLGGRRLTALAVLLCAWALAIGLCAPWPRARARALRAGAIGVLWAPVVVLIPAALEPGALAEYLVIALACLVLGALADALLPWPRAAIAPALVALVALTADALAHTQLLMRSLLGPNPILGARFYGIGNEIKSGLAVLVLAAVAGALYPAVRGRRGALAMIAAGVVLAAIEGSARIGAGVGGVILVSAAFAVAAATLAGGALTHRRTAIVVISPLLALIALAALDLLTAHGTGHYSGSILHASSAGELRDVIVRRYSAAWGELHNHAMPAASAAALACAVVAVRRRDRLLAPVAGDPGWLAVLSGGLTAGFVGALSEDSGPVLLVVAVFALGCVATYLWAGPVRRAPPARSTLAPTAAAAARPAD